MLADVAQPPIDMLRVVTAPEGDCVITQRERLARDMRRKSYAGSTARVSFLRPLSDLLTLDEACSRHKIATPCRNVSARVPQAHRDVVPPFLLLARQYIGKNVTRAHLVDRTSKQLSHVAV